MLRPYQKECLEKIMFCPPGKYLVVLPTASGKTYIFSKIPFSDRKLILTHREEILNQTEKYYDNYSVGYEQAERKSKRSDAVVLGSIQSMVRRLKRFDPEDFDTIVYDEAHTAACKTAKTILNHFKPRKLIGFTATPNRADNAALGEIFDEIIYTKNIREMIQDGWLADVECRKVETEVDLDKVHTRMGDYVNSELAEVCNVHARNVATAEAIAKYARGKTVVFAINVAHAMALHELIPNSKVITGETKNRAEILKDFTVLININVLVEGWDCPDIGTIVMARPTKSELLYIQAVGRGLRKDGDKKLLLVDITDNCENLSLCFAPTLFGIKSSPKTVKYEVADLLDLPERIEIAEDRPESWIKNVKRVNLWAKENNLNTYDIFFVQFANGQLKLSLPKVKYVISKPDKLGRCSFNGEQYQTQQGAIDQLYTILQEKHSEEIPIWNMKIAQRSWGNSPWSDKQKELIEKRCPQLLKKYSYLTKFEASLVLNRLFSGR